MFFNFIDLEDFANDTDWWFGEWGWHFGPFILSAKPDWSRRKYTLATLLLPRFLYKRNSREETIRIIEKWLEKHPDSTDAEYQKKRLSEILENKARAEQESK